jgi:hypothetical protein
VLAATVFHQVLLGLLKHAPVAAGAAQTVPVLPLALVVVAVVVLVSLVLVLTRLQLECLELQILEVVEAAVVITLCQEALVAQA